jgi:hypothetical protein
MKLDKTKRQKLKDRYLRDALPVRLGNLASNLARIRSFSSETALNQATIKVLDESKCFIEWTAADAELSLQVELLELQRLLANWRLAWDEIWPNLEKRNDVARQASLWSQRLLERSGLLNPQKNQT